MTIDLQQLGRVVLGAPEPLKAALEAFNAIPVDLDLNDRHLTPHDPHQTTLRHEATATGPGTFLSRAQRTLRFLPSEEPGWWIDRHDLPDALPVKVAIENVWTTGAIVSNIVLRSGSPHNYLRMVEHIIALKVGLGIDNLVIRLDSGDPPLFERGSLDLVEALERAGRRPLAVPAVHVAVSEPVVAVGAHGNFLAILPPPAGDRGLTLDCAVDFPNAIGRQRLRLRVGPEMLRQGAVARTNTSLGKMLYCKTIGKLFADIRNLGYTQRNVLVAGKHRYINPPRLMHGPKSLEAVWHRAVLDLLAAVALIGQGRLAGHIVSYKAGHVLDCRMIARLHRERLLETLP